jgi:hypothetical protein
MASHVKDDGAQFDGFGAGAEDEQDLGFRGQSLG